MLIVTAHIESKPGFEEKTKAELLKLVAPTLCERGCLKYELHTSIENPAEFLFYEIWESQSDLERHSKSEHISSFREKRSLFLACDPIVQLWEHTLDATRS